MPVPKIPRILNLRLGRLLDMMYKPGELAAELKVSTETVVRSYLPAGAPVTVDAQGRTWINGKKFASWVREYLANERCRGPAQAMSANEGFCLRCNQIVEMANPHRRRHSQRQTVLQVYGKCPQCGATVNRFVREAITS